MDVRRGFGGDSEEVEGRVSGRRMVVGPGDSETMKRDGGHAKGEGDSNERSCPVHVRDLNYACRKLGFEEDSAEIALYAKPHVC